MYVRLPLLGTGLLIDPYRVALPSYSMVEVNEVDRSAIVYVADSELPDDTQLRVVLGGTAVLRHGISNALYETACSAWHAHLDERYAEHRGRFRPWPIRSKA